MNIFRIDDINDPRIAPYRSLKMRNPEDDGLFIVENEPSVNALLESGMNVVSCVTTESFYDKFRKKAEISGKNGIDFYLMDKPYIEDLIGFKFHHGIMMAAKLPRRKSFSELEKDLPSPRLIVALNSVHDPQNVGLITRNVAAFGAGVMVVDPGTHEPYYRKVTRISMGSIFRINVAYENDIETFLKKLKEKGTKIIVPSLENDSIDLDKADLTGDICIVMGNEAEGASKKVQDIADVRVRIPHHFDKADSLNVACASSILMYAAYIQRKRENK